MQERDADERRVHAAALALDLVLARLTEGVARHAPRVNWGIELSSRPVELTAVGS